MERYALQSTGFDSKQAAQDLRAIFMIRVLLSGTPVIGLVLALVSLLRFKLTEERMLEIRWKLQARRDRL